MRCEYRDFDSKRTPISREYVTALESRVATLERCIEQLRDTPFREMDEGIDFVDDLPPSAGGALGGCRNEMKSPLLVGVQNTYLMQSFQTHREDVPLLPNEQRSENISQDPTLLECLDLFFRWQNPSILFFDEDEFLENFGSETQHCGSAALAYSMAALGALMSQNLTVRKMADDYSTRADDRLSPRLLQPGTACINACLLCTTYHAGNGNTLKAALYSG